MSARESLPTATPIVTARIRLRLVGPEGREFVQDFAAATSTEAIRRATSRGLVVLGIEPAPPVSATGRRQFPLSLFSQELLALLDAGLNLTEALTTLHIKERQPTAEAILAQILSALREGRSFSEALSTLPLHFPEVYVATVRAAERTGDLPRALARYIAYQLQLEAIRKKLMSAAIYPAMLLVVGGFVTLFLLGYVVPRFSAVYESSGRDLPALSMLLLTFGKTIFNHWQIALVGVVSLFGAIGWWLAQAQGRARLLDMVLRVPWLAARTEEFRLARFYRAVSLLLGAGIALPRAIGMVNGLLSLDQQKRLQGARLAVEQGRSLSVALAAADLSTPIADSLIKVGERSGQMAEMLERAARFHDEDFARWIDWASRLLEPVLMTVIGVVIGGVVVLMYMPIFDLAGGMH